MPRMSHRSGLGLTLAAELALSAVPSGASTAPVASAATLHRCHMTAYQEQHLGTTYVRLLKVDHVSCGTGRKVVKAVQKCRHAHGGVRGRCPGTALVLGRHCTEKWGGIATQFTGKVNCTRGSRRVMFFYMQNT